MERQSSESGGGSFTSNLDAVPITSLEDAISYANLRLKISNVPEKWTTRKWTAGPVML
jgi:hypothetical protein